MIIDNRLIKLREVIAKSDIPDKYRQSLYTIIVNRYNDKLPIICQTMEYHNRYHIPWYRSIYYRNLVTNPDVESVFDIYRTINTKTLERYINRPIHRNDVLCMIDNKSLLYY